MTSSSTTTHAEKTPENKSPYVGVSYRPWPCEHLARVFWAMYQWVDAEVRTCKQFDYHAELQASVQHEANSQHSPLLARNGFFK